MVKREWKRFGCSALMLILAVSLAACGKKGYDPVAINPAVDTCAQCKMAVGDNSHAAELILADGTPKKFDDIGCLLTYQAEQGQQIQVSDRYVRDAKTNQWVRFEQAYFVHGKDLDTPMGYGIVTFAKKEDAEAFAKEQKLDKVMTAGELEQMKLERNPAKMNMKMHMDKTMPMNQPMPMNGNMKMNGGAEHNSVPSGK